MLPPWAAGALTALLVLVCAVALSRIGRDSIIGDIARVALVLVGAALAVLYLQGSYQQDVAAERRALEARASALGTRATMPGSPLACLDAMAGDAVEGSCERKLFASPEALSSAVSYAAAQLNLFVDVSRFVKRGNTGLEPLLATLRRAVESDRYGLVAHVLATRDGCNSERCLALASMSSGQRVSGNLAQRTYDLYVARHSGDWPSSPPGAVANAPPPSPSTSGSSRGGPGTEQPLPPEASAFVSPAASRASKTGVELFFPNSETIPPVNIMTAEPAGGQSEATGSAPPRTSPKRPAQKDQSKQQAAQKDQSKQQAAQKDQSKQQAPIDLNTARGAPPAQ